jgi:hypothetical protein
MANPKIYAVSGDAIDRLRQENVIREAIGELSIVEIGEGAMVRLDKHELTVKAASGTGHTAKLVAATLPAGATVTWTSSATGKATVSNGTVTGVAAGNTIVKAAITVGGVTYFDICNVTVE